MHWSTPPIEGALQARARILNPLPQEAVHWDHEPHSCHSGTAPVISFEYKKWRCQKDYLPVVTFVDVVVVDDAFVVVVFSGVVVLFVSVVIATLVVVAAATTT